MCDTNQVLHQGTIQFVEVRFFFQATVEGTKATLALGSLYSPANEYHKTRTHGALVVCRYEGEESLVVIRVNSIISVVGMMPFEEQHAGYPQFYLVEKFGLGVVDTGGIVG